MSNKLKQMLLIVLLGMPIVFFIVGEAAQTWGYFKHRRMPERFVLTDGFQGWVTLVYDFPDCDALPVADGKRLYNIPTTGELCTQSPYTPGWAEDTFVFASAPDDNIAQNQKMPGNKIWNETQFDYKHANGKVLTVRGFWVGDRQTTQQKNETADLWLKTMTATVTRLTQESAKSP
jgi:hypothetical protein